MQKNTIDQPSFEENPQTLLSKGNKALREEQYLEAIALFNKAIEQNPSLTQTLEFNIRLAHQKAGTLITEERRKISAEAISIKSSGLFNADWYIEKAKNKNDLDPAEHYLQYGVMLGINPSPYFDAKYYLEANSDVAKAGVNPLLHYINHGAQEGRPIAPTPDSVKSSYQSKSTTFNIHISNNPKTQPDLFNLKAKFSQENNLIILFANSSKNFQSLINIANSFSSNFSLIVIIPSTFNYDELSTIESSHREIDVVTFSIGHEIFALVRLINNDIFYSSNNALIINFEDEINAEIDSNILNKISFFGKKVTHNYGLIGIPNLQSALKSHDPIRDKAAQLLGKIGSRVLPEPDINLSLSLCYINTLLLKSIRALQADPSTFSQINRTDARLLLKMILTSMSVEGTLEINSFNLIDPKPEIDQKKIRSIAFYLPQFHVVPENDKWWGKGFTEWHNVVRARPLFQNHYQPRIPADLGFYDLSSTETQIKQAEIAKKFGVDGFCYYYYWFDGKKVLHKPIENMLANQSVDMPFCVCWANENWSRNWDGQNRHVLLDQTYSTESNKAIIQEFIKYMKDPRYIRHERKPVLIVYRIKIIPEWEKVALMWREECRKAGIGEIHLCSVRFGLEGLEGDPSAHGLDAYVMFPPHELKFEDHRNSVSNLSKDFGGTLYSYDAAMQSDIERFSSGRPWPVHRGAMMGWDNTARRLKDSRIFFGCTPLKFRSWLKSIKDQENIFNKSSESLVFINAWNEWAEGTHLEPDQRFGTSYLQATHSIFGEQKTFTNDMTHKQKKMVYSSQLKTPSPLLIEGHKNTNANKQNILLCAHISGHQLFGGERSFLDVARSLSNLNYNLIITLPSANNKIYIDELKKYSSKIYVINYKQWIDNRDHEHQITLAFCDVIATNSIDLVYANTIVLIEPLKAANLMGKKSVVHARELISFDVPLQERIGLSAPEIISKVFQSCDYIIANSYATQKTFAREGKTFYAPNAVDVTLFPSRNLLKGKIKVGIISSNIPKKGVSDFLKIASICQSNPNLEFLVIGPENKFTEEWKDQQQHGLLPSNIIFTGYINTPQEAISKIHLLISTSSFAESFGRTVAEAMAGCRPVIAYEWGALSELIISNETGYLAPYGNYQKIAEILLALSKKPDRIIELGIKAKEHIESHFSHTILEKNLDLALSDIFSETTNSKETGVVTTIIVPVYNAADEVIQCLNSLYLHTSPNSTKIIIINDGSSDTRIKDIINSYKDKPNTSIFHNEKNIGYTKTVNYGIKLSEQNSDIILLNSDTRLTPFWLEGLRATAYRFKTTGTVTAMSDNAGAFSFPKMNQANKVPCHFTEDEYSNFIIANAFDCDPVEVPTGSGFCFYIKRTLINEIGIFDEVLFPRGYGEENDFCMRAAIAGYKNLITPWSYVYHARTASFKGEKAKLVDEGVSKVITKYPFYPVEVKRAFYGEKIEQLRSAFVSFE